MRSIQLLFYSLILFPVLFCASCSKVTQESDSQNKGEATIDTNSSSYQQMLKQRIADSLAMEKERKNALAKEQERIAKEAAERQREKDIIDERDNPQKYIDFDTEAHRKLIASRSVLNGHIRTTAKYGYYESVVIKVSYYSKSDILLGSELVNVGRIVDDEYRPFSRKIKPVKKAYKYRCKLYGATYVEFVIGIQ